MFRCNTSYRRNHPGGDDMISKWKILPKGWSNSLTFPCLVVLWGVEFTFKKMIIANNRKNIDVKVSLPRLRLKNTFSFRTEGTVYWYFLVLLIQNPAWTTQRNCNTFFCVLRQLALILIIRIVCLTVRRITNLIWKLKG